MKLVLAASFDLLVLAFVGIWIIGGVPMHGHVYLSHGADPRRAAILLTCLGYAILSKHWPFLKEKSTVLQTVSWMIKKAHKPSLQWATLTATCLASIAISIQQCNALHITLFDVGIFHQILWSLSNGLGFHSTVSGAGNFLQDHLSLSLITLVPFYRAAQGSPYFLPVFINLLLFGGASAWLYLAQRISDTTLATRNRLSIATVVFIVSFDSLWKNAAWGFHENALAFFGFSWAFALLFTSTHPTYLRKSLILLLALVASFSKEILLLNGALFFICWAYVEFKTNVKNRLWISFLTLLAISFIFGFIQFELMPHPVTKNYFNRYYSYLGNDLHGFLAGILTSPFKVIQTIGTGELLKYAIAVLSPWLFIPLLRFIPVLNKTSAQLTHIWLITLLPSLASAALATYYALRRADFHYVLELWPVLGCLTILWLAHKRSKQWIWAWALFGLIRMDYDPIGTYRDYSHRAKELLPVRVSLLAYAHDASIMADELTGPWLAGRQWITRAPETAFLPQSCPQHAVLRDNRIPEIPGCNSIRVWNYADWSGYQLTPESPRN